MVANRLYTKAMKFRIVLEFDPEARSFSAVCPELPGCASAGETEEEARINIEEAIKLYLAPSEILLPDNAKLVEVTIG
jgi:predicted RNase H-like HicB family nuclease